MSKTFEINAQQRTDEGKGASRRLRRTGEVPGIIYGGEKEPAMITLKHHELVQHLENEAFYSHILKVKIKRKSEEVILKGLQRHPAKPLILHIDFQRISADKKIRTRVPVHFMNESTAPGVKAGGVVSHHMTDIEVICLPGDLPEFIEADLAGMEIGDSISLTAISPPNGVEILALTQGDEQDMVVASIHSGHMAEEVEEEEEEEGEELEAPTEEEDKEEE